MQKPFKIFLYLLLAVPVMFSGCQKSELLNDSGNSATLQGENSVKSAITYSPCGTQLVANLYVYKNTGTPYGTVTIGNDETKIYVTYKLNPGYIFESNSVFAGPASNLPTGDWYPSVINGDGTGFFYPNLFKYQNWVDWNKDKIVEFTFELNRSDLPQCFVLVAFARVRDVNGQRIVVSAKAQTAFKSDGYYLDYCQQTCGSGCETAYANGNNLANCFLSIPGVNSNNWGWSNGPISAGTYNWPIYAGAGQCNTSKGTLVGTLNVVYTPPTAKITYVMSGNVHLSTTQLYVGSEILPKKNNKWTTAPGQFPYKHENLNGVNSDSFTINGLSGKIYIAAHSDVCW